MAKRVLKTKLCDLLGIEYPILSAGMGPTLIGERTGAPVELVVAVSEAGGLGVLGGSGYTVDELREAIRQIKAQTDKPFGVDLLLPQKLDMGGDLARRGWIRYPSAWSCSPFPRPIGTGSKRSGGRWSCPRRRSWSG